MELKKAEEKLEPRQRKKKLINEVKDLLDFYFSPANLGKDIFMRSLLEKDPFIDLQIFHQFNKIKNLTSETKILQKAVKKSDILELSEDGCKVKRRVPVEIKQNEMECTIYVENLPPNSTHEWLQKVFSLYGTIDYISLPRFQQSGRPKGFAFIEFHTPQEAQKALEAFGGLASLDGTLNPAELLTIRTFGQAEEKIEENRDHTLPASEKNVVEKFSKQSCTEAFSKDVPDSEERPKKKLKTGEEEKKYEMKKKKKRRRSKKGKEYEPDSVYLRVMSKRDWKRLRNKYLNTQRENMKQLKCSFQHQKDEFSKLSLNLKTNAGSINHDIVRSNKPEFIPDVIVKITLNESPQDPREFREGLTNGRPSIAYIDISSKMKDVYVRFKSSEDSKHFISEGLWKNVHLLKEEEEHQYWEKVFTSWEQRRPKKRKRNTNDTFELPTFRGRDKICSRALKQKNNDSLGSHIVFED